MDPSVDTQQKEEAAAEGRSGERARGKKKDETVGERKPVGRRWSVGTISADACSYAVRVLLSRAEIPAGFLRSLSSRAAFAERWNGGEQGCRKKERDEKKEGEREGDWKREVEEIQTSPRRRGTGLPRHSLQASGVMKSSSWRTSWLHFARIRRRRRASCNGKILYSAATERGASREARGSRCGL